MNSSSIDYSPRYSKSWPQVSRLARKITCDRCCYCWFRRADQAHHAQYSFTTWYGWRARVCDRERKEIGKSIFPVCGAVDEVGSCHNLLHRKENWIKSREDSVWLNRNTPKILFQLRLRFWLLRAIVDYYWVLGGVVGGWFLGQFVWR